MLNFLIVEHDEDEANNLMYFLRFVGESFFWVSDIRTAIDVLMACSIHLDALITSLSIPITRKQLNFEPSGGIEIAQAARIYRPGLPVFLCASRGVYHRSTTNLAFDVGFIPKPARIEDLIIASQTLRHLKGGVL